MVSQNSKIDPMWVNWDLQVNNNLLLKMIEDGMLTITKSESYDAS